MLALAPALLSHTKTEHKVGMVTTLGASLSPLIGCIVFISQVKSPMVFNISATGTDCVICVMDWMEKLSRVSHQLIQSHVAICTHKALSYTATIYIVYMH